jgi:hypothetical protein
MTFYSDLAAVATRLLTDKGQQVTFSRETSTGFDPEAGINTTTTSTITGYGAAFDYNSSEIDGTIVVKGDIRFLFEAGSAPQQDDVVTIDSIIYRVMAVKTTSPAGTAVLYECQLRK